MINISNTCKITIYPLLLYKNKKFDIFYCSYWVWWHFYLFLCNPSKKLQYKKKKNHENVQFPVECLLCHVLHKLWKNFVIFFYRFIDPIKISMIGELVLSQDVYTIKVRIIRLWKQTSWNKPQQICMISMILNTERVFLNFYVFSILITLKFPYM